MEKIPTLFLRDPENRRYVQPEVDPQCAWVLDGVGRPTRKYDGTCVMFDGAAWWARREVKPGKTPPPNYWAISTDEVTGRTVGWEPVEQSSFAKFHAEALACPYGVVQQNERGTWRPDDPPQPGTYELCGPKINGNPERINGTHLVIRHGTTAAEDQTEMQPRLDAGGLPRDFDGLRRWLHAHPTWEGLVFHHPDGRMAKIKRRDMPDV